MLHVTLKILQILQGIMEVNVIYKAQNQESHSVGFTVRPVCTNLKSIKEKQHTGGGMEEPRGGVCMYVCMYMYGSRRTTEQAEASPGAARAT